MRDPGTRLIGRYLRACGKRWLEVADILDDVETLEPAGQTIPGSELAEKDKAALSRAVKRQVERYAPSQAYPSRGRPRRIEDQHATVRRFAEYRRAVVLVEHDVTELLKTRLVPGIDYAKYKAAARQMLGRLWRGEPASAREFAQQRAELVKKGLNSTLAKAVQALVRRWFARRSESNES